MDRIKKNKKGFSLVELICAVAILGATITVLLNAFVIGTNVSKKRVKQSEATLAGKNVLEAAAAVSIDDFYSEDSSGEIKTLLGNNVNVSLMEDNTYRIDENGEKVKGDGSFTVALENIKAGTSTMDAVVEFSRGDALASWTDDKGAEVQSLSHGLYLINSEKIKLAQYDAMDGVLCQPYEIGSNPDLLVENEIGALARSYGLDPETDLTKRDRKIRLYVMHDPQNDWTLTEGVEKPYNDDGTPNENFEDLEHTGRYHYATVKYEYVFTFSKLFVDNNGRPSNTLTWNRTYTVFPGGYEPQNKDGSVSIYLMYYPVYSDRYASDEIHIYNNSIDPSKTSPDDSLEYWIEGQENPYTVALNTYLYCQDSYGYNEDTYEYEYTTNPNKVNERIVLHFPQDYDSSANRLTDTYIYTNAGEICTKTSGIFEYINQAGAHFGVGADLSELIDSDLVRKEDKIKIYNIKVTLYKSNPDDPNIVDTEGVKTVRDGVEPEYIVNGTKTN